MLKLKTNALKYKKTDGSMDDIGVVVGGQTVDDTLSKTSANPVQNKVVAEEFEKISNEVDKTVKSVNGKTGAVNLTASDIGAQPVGDYALMSDIPQIPESVLYTAQELNLDQQAQARTNIGAADLDSLIEVFEDIDELKANAGGNTIIGVIDTHYYNFRFLNEERGATMAEIREAAQSKDKDIVIRLDLDNWQGTLQYLGLVNLTDDGSTYREVLLFSTIKMNNGVVNTADNIVSGTVQLEYWYTPLDPGDDMPSVAFVNCQFAEINLAPGASHAGSFMRVNEDGMWDVEKVDIIQPPATASVGQTLAVKAVDENSKPTEWETVDGNPGIKRIESLDKENLIQLRDLETGPYILYGWFSPFPNSDTSMTFDNTITIVSRKDAGSHLLVLTGLNSKINFLEILVDETNEKGFTYTRTDFVLNDLHGLLSRVDELEKPKESVSIVDKVTGVTYLLEVVNGTLTMSEVTE